MFNCAEMYTIYYMALAPYQGDKNMYQEIINTRIAGIPAKVGVKHIYRQAGSFMQNEVSDLDYHGYLQFDYELLDMQGKRAYWLERKLTDDMRSEIERLIAEAV